MNDDASPRVSHFLLLVLLAFVWGSSFILMKRALFDTSGARLYSASQVAAMRIVFAGLALSPVLFKALRKVPRDRLIWLFAVGLLGNTIPAFLFTNAQLRLPSSMAGMLNALTPLFTLLVALLLFRRSYRKVQMLGLLIGLAGAIGLIQLRGSGGSTHWASAALVVLATICYAFSVNIIRNKLGLLKSVHIAAVSLGMMAIPCALYLPFSGLSEVFSAYRPDAWAGLGATIALGAIGTAAALVIFNRIIQETSAIFASSVTYVIPVFAALWGWLDGEELQVWHAFFAAIILSGVYLVNSPQKSL